MENSNRKIAFRAWHKEMKYISPVGQLNEMKSVLIYVPEQTDEDGNVDWNGDIVPMEKVELMQFTGLKDKNGVDIYEGDFVSNGKNTWQVEFMGGSFWLSKKHDILGSESTPMYRALLPSKFMNLDYPDGEIGTVEVVGNIYENQELIK